ncbi:MAG: aspartate carbamoyltransferase regulatory subunit [Defluviitaleaceae bacterium]|nr:aspartate carbamoyltransferase regulatory subunit [Defluviitaleaceae bacterium]
MQIDGIEKGIVIDHIRAGYGIKVLEHLNIDTTKNTVALIMNAISKKHGRKDIIKLQNIDNVDYNVLGVIDHNATVNIIENFERVEKVTLQLPQTIKNVFVCKNPRCVTSIENEPHIFHLFDESGRYRCEYCDNIAEVSQ